MIYGVSTKPEKNFFVSDAPSKENEKLEIPMSGTDGRLFNQLLISAGISRPDCYITQVLPERPPSGDIEKFLVPKAALPSTYLYPPVLKGKYLDPRFLSCLPRLAAEIRDADPNIIVAMGNLACWALLSQTGVGKLRGAVAPCTLVHGKKVLPTLHPSYIMRSWGENIIARMDLKKALRESEYPEIRRPEREFWVSPDLSDIARWLHENRDATHIAVDIETADMMITCIGFAASPEQALVVPFRDLRKPDGNYWASEEAEIGAWNLVQDILRLPAVKIFQNGLYDLQYIWRTGLSCLNATADTMLLHHSLYPEMSKGLGFLGSLYSSESSWKLMHKRSRDED